MTYLEVLKGHLTVKITQMNCQMQKLADQDDPPKRQIGFVISSNDENEEDADEDL